MFSPHLPPYIAVMCSAVYCSLLHLFEGWSLVLGCLTVFKMAPRRTPSSRTPLAPSYVTLSIEQRFALLRPGCVPPPVAPRPASSSSVVSSGSAASFSKASSSATSGTRPRPLRDDVPVVKHARRGDFSMVANQLENDGVDGMLVDLHGDRYSRSSASTHTSRLSTWQAFHEGIFGDAVPLLPLTVRTFTAVSAAFKRGGYRSFPNYVSDIKSAHLEQGHDWNQHLDAAARWCTRSVLRGIGPARQSCAFRFDELMLLKLGHQPLTPDGCYGPWHMTVLSSLFLLREVEVAQSSFDHWLFNDKSMEITWTLPASKTDTQALGTERTLGCLCGVPHLGCPYHVAVEHLKAMQQMFGVDRTADLPLFPGVDGAPVAKAAIVETFELLGARCGQPTASAAGLRLFGGHTARVTGAQAYATAGVEVNKIRILARHSGESILRYVAETPLKSVRHDLGLGTSASSVPAPELTPIHERIDALQLALTALADTASSQQATSSAPSTTVTRLFSLTTARRSCAATIRRRRTLQHVDGNMLVHGPAWAAA